MLMASRFSNVRGGIAAALLLAMTFATGAGLAAWKFFALRGAEAASAKRPEPVEAVTAVVAATREHRPTTTSIGTVLALRSVTLRNEVAGTVRSVNLTPGQIVAEGTVLVGLDVSVETAELKAQEAQASLAETILGRLEPLAANRAVPALDVDRARAERDVAIAQIARTRAIIARKTIRAPFRARVGISDVHPGQYLNEGTELTTLQGIDAALHVDFTVAQRVAATLKDGEAVEVYAASGITPIPAHIVALDSRVDPTTRNAVVRATIVGAPPEVTPGASVRVLVPTGPAATAVAIPVSALRKGPEGDHVFVIAPDQAGKPRAHLRPVEAGTVVGDEVLIVSGLTPGEKVATSGSFKLRESVLISINSVAAATGAK
jgi:membrane fusion protein (multidrug efflux system)